MGKAEDEQPLPLNVDSAIYPSEADADRNRCPRRISKFLRFRCVIALVLGASVLLSAIFWLKPLFRPRDQVDLDLAALLKAHDIVASFKLQKPVSELNAYIPQLELDIFEEMAIFNSTVEVLSLVPSAASNMTIVVFSVVPITKNSNISSASLSLLKSDFVSFVLHQSSLRLSPSLFGDPFAFEVLKLKGGITVVPQQSAFLLQKVQTLFDFSLNFSIYQILDSFNELEKQLKSGLRLSSFENLYVSLSNSYGSTVAPPTTIKASVLLAVRNRPPSMPRLKQLAQTITGSPAKNLGLNHSEFGKVKQVRLSSVLQHSLNSSNDNGKSPSPAPLPHVDHHRHHHHHHHHHHRHHRDTDLAPSPSVEKGHGAKPPLPSGCRGLTGKVKRHAPLAPAVAPVVPPSHSTASPHLNMEPPIPAPAPAPYQLHAPPPLPVGIFAHAHPPSEKLPPSEPPDLAPMISPSPSSSVATCPASIKWFRSLLLPLITCIIIIMIDREEIFQS
ncbi:hypothetical protein Scep_003145 [Stephania cephalantha]|uniref:DUF7036 domain-containing protein n=1 Tax=Stephania cephalantha TaxID=152367 RepID=A0AAP0KQ39_9MAGN